MSKETKAAVLAVVKTPGVKDHKVKKEKMRLDDNANRNESAESKRARRDRQLAE